MGSFGFADWDEAIYAEISRNVLTGHFLTLFWDDANWFQKPPLAFWLEAGSFKLFGVSEFSARLLSAISGITLAWITYNFCRKLFSQKIAVLGLLLFTSNSFLLFYSRFATTDILVACLSTAALYFFWLSEERKIFLYPFFLLVGLAVMTKGPAGFLPLAVVFIYLALSRRLLNYIRTPHLWFAGIIMLIIALPWHIYMLNEYGMVFWREYYDYHILLRSQVAIEGHNERWFYYIKNIVEYFPIAVFLPLIFLLPKEAVRKNQNSITFLAVWFLVQFATIQSVATRIEWYILPVHIPLIIFLALIIYYLVLRNKIFISLTVFFLLATVLAPFYLPSRWSEIKLNEENKKCLKMYQSLTEKQNTYYLNGFFEPTSLFYLNSKSIRYLDVDGGEIPSGVKVLFGSDKETPAGRLVTEYIGCKIVEKTD